jgi:hypothetical protein
MFESESDFVRNIQMIGNDSTHFCAQTLEMESLKRCFFLKGLTIQKFWERQLFRKWKTLFFFREN